MSMCIVLMIGDSWKLGIALRKVLCIIWALVILYNAILYGYQEGYGYGVQQFLKTRVQYVRGLKQNKLELLSNHLYFYQRLKNVLSSIWRIPIYAFAFGLGCMDSLHAKIVYDKAPIDDIVLIYDWVCFVLLF